MMSYRAILVGSCLFLAGMPSASAASYTQIFSFPGVHEGGPVGGVIADKSGALYVATDGPAAAGDTGAGAVFKLTPPAPGKATWTVSPLYMFQHGVDAQIPSSKLLFDATGALYGVAASGGDFGKGAVYKLTPPAAGESQWTESVIYSFDGTVDGLEPVAALVFDSNGSLYGTTSAGGAHGYGTAFKLTPPAAGQTNWTGAVLHQFRGGADGGEPDAALVFGPDGALYGTTTVGGNPPGGNETCFNFGCGTVFKLSPPAAGKTAWTEQILAKFNGAGGLAFPQAELIFDSAGALYGTTSNGGDSRDGAVFKLLPPTQTHAAWQLQTLYRFRNRLGGRYVFDGAQPEGGVVFDPAGALYGSTVKGGGGQDDGTIYQLLPPTPAHAGWSQKTLFKAQVNDYPYATPSHFTGSLWRDPKTGTLYGVSQDGGLGNSGTVFAITP